MTVLNSEGLEKAAKAYDDALNNPVFVDCRKCQGTGYHHGFGETGHDPDWCLDCVGSKVVMAAGEDARPLKSAITAYLSALPPVDGLEVVGWRWPEPMAEGSKFHSVTNAEPPCSGWQELVTLSQASSVIAGLKEANEALMRERTNLIETKREQIDRLTKERDEAVDRAKVWEHYWSQEVKVKSEVVSWAKEAMDKADTAEARISSLEKENKRLREALDRAMDWIRAAPHDDHCFTNDPNPDACRCVCGKDTLLDTLGDHNG